MDMKIQLDPKQIDKATKDLLKKQAKEISKLSSQVEKLKYELGQVKRDAIENLSFKQRVRDAKRTLCDLFDLSENEF